MFDPYAGTGASYIRALNGGATANTTAGNFTIKNSRNSFGPALQVGLDINIKDGWLILTLKKYGLIKILSLMPPF